LITPVDSNSKNVPSYNFVNAIEDVLNANQFVQQSPTLIANQKNHCYSNPTRSDSLFTLDHTR